MTYEFEGKTEKEAIYDQIVGAMKLTNNGTIDVAETYSVAETALGNQGMSVGILGKDGTFTVTEKVKSCLDEVKNDRGIERFSPIYLCFNPYESTEVEAYSKRRISSHVKHGSSRVNQTRGRNGV